MSRWILFVASFALALPGCTSLEEKQWYKPGVNYTMADFERDQAACAKGKVVDEDCLRGRGWVSISPDKNTIPPMKGGLQTEDSRRFGPSTPPKQQ